MIGQTLALLPIETLLNVLGFILALVAIGFTIHESWSNHCVRLSIEEFKNSGRVSFETKGKWIQELHLRVRNRGIPLYSTTIGISFNLPDSFSTINFVMKPRTERTGKIDEFARGMVAEFSIRSCDNKEYIQMIASLQNCRKQHAFLNVFSQDYQVKRWKIGGIWDRLVGPWNRFSLWFCVLSEH